MLTQFNLKLQQRLGLSMPETATFCQHWHITELSLFGSVLGDRFHSDRNTDILIRFAPNTRQGLLTNVEDDPSPSLTLPRKGANNYLRKV